MGWAGRLWAGAIACGCLVVLGIASWLQPSPAGHGTHTQIGLPACGWAGLFGSPCPTCGMTTAFAHAAEGRPVEAFVAQPFGALLALSTAAALWMALHVAVTGSHLGRVGARLLRPRALWWIAGGAAASWIYKMMTWHPG